jgi:hypothetical protein
LQESDRSLGFLIPKLGFGLVCESKRGIKVYQEVFATYKLKGSVTVGKWAFLGALFSGLCLELTCHVLSGMTQNWLVRCCPPGMNGVGIKWVNYFDLPLFIPAQRKLRKR